MVSRCRRFHCGIATDGQHFIYDGDRPVIRYWFVVFGRLGTLREYNAEFIADGSTIACIHGGLTRSLLRYLNDGYLSDPQDVDELYEGEATLRKLDRLRREQQL